MDSFHLSTGVVALDAVRSPARRSTSIFSRRGTASLEPSITPLSPSTMGIDKSESRRPSAWKRRLSIVNKKVRQGSQDTILHAVPPANAIPTITPLEKAMMTSPNEEILSAISKETSKSSLSILPASNEWNASPRTASCQSPKWHADDSKIGVWRDGVALWDVQARRTHSIDITTSPISYQVPEYAVRPNLSVIIPGEVDTSSTQPSRSRYSLPAIPVVSVPYTNDESAIHPAFRTTKDFLQPRSQRRTPSATETTTVSRSSTNSSIVIEETSDNASSYSHNSSMTSVEEEEEPTDLLQNPDWNSTDVPKRLVSAAFSITSPVIAGVFDDQTPIKGQSGATLEVCCPPSPTLSEAVNDLHTQLGTIPEGYLDCREARYEEGPPDVPQPPTLDLTRAPTIPKRSRKREWRTSSLAIPRPNPLQEPSAQVLGRRLSVPSTKELLDKHHPDEFRRSNSTRSIAGGDAGPQECEMSLGSAQMSLLLSAINTLGPAPHTTMPSTASLRTEAQTVLLRIMSCLNTIEDLHAMSMINKGMYQVFRANEMSLLRTVLRNKSAASWELREWSPVQFSELDTEASTSQREHSPSTYIHGFRQDEFVIRALKTLILQRCQSFLRNETVAALVTDEDLNAQRFDDAFYRLWCFCKIFGCEKGREDDVTGQLDWLRGGLLAHQQDCAATVNVNLEFDMGGVLLNAPDHFALGNAEGLSASQLYDMTELWNCLAALLSGYHGRIGQARSCGIYDNTDIAPGNIVGEEAVLEEWMTYILTLGPPVVLELARFSEDNSDAGFKFAKLNGWTEWSLSSTSRNAFFREPVARLYEERIAFTAMNGSSRGQEMKEVGRRRVASLAAEIKVARCSSNYQRLPLIDMASERAMSVYSVHSRDDSVLRSQSPASQYNGWNSRRVSPIIEDRVETFNRLSLLSLEGVAENTADRAIAKIVGMGFSTAQATEALKLTDMGNGLRVDRAVDFLLRQH